MLLFIGGFIVGGMAGAIVMALVVAASDERRSQTSHPRTAASGRAVGSSWVIAGNGTVTSGSRLGRFFVAQRRPLLRSH